MVATIFVMDPWQLFGLTLKSSGSAKLVETDAAVAAEKEVEEAGRRIEQAPDDRSRREEVLLPDRREAMERAPLIILCYRRREW
mmetsp:Transcript_26071/g.57239  ORF Transcript_26071/g.57239 Transcript_26071/m.57239 type:complete len:84 (-) Transcript_26071:105-356(-)